MDISNIKSQGPLNTNTPSPFLTLPSLPIPLSDNQCMTYKHEILIFGGWKKNDCYSYHTLQNKYKRICTYPNNVVLQGHSVVKIASSSNDITLLSFGGQDVNERKHTLVMKYQSVWDENDEIGNKANLNQWLPFTNSSNEPIEIGRDGDDYCGVRAVVGGSNDHLLFISYRPKNIDVFDLNTCQYIQHVILPTDNNYVCYHCFVLRPAYGMATVQTNKKKTGMMLFCEKTGFAIEYDEDNNTFEFNKTRVWSTIREFNCYAYVHIDDALLFFGGLDYRSNGSSKVIHKYLMNENRWTKFEQILPIPLKKGVAVLSGDNTYVHILGGKDGKFDTISTHLKTEVKEWMKEETEMEKKWITEEKQKIITEQNERDILEIGYVKKDADVVTEKSHLKEFKRCEEIEITINRWLRLLSIKVGWIDDFTIITSRFIM
ncbi:hypothetical protein RFI_06379, partial [Reticulomyxa filosa]